MRTLLEEHVPRVWRFALRLTGDRDQAEDLTQETLLRAWRHRRRLRDPNKTRVWLFKIATNLWRDQARRARRHSEETTSSADELPSSNMPPEQHVIDREDVQRTLDAMDGLPPRQREVLYLHACEGLCLAEIADVLDISSDAVKASLSLARKRMRRQLDDLCPDRFPTG
ncbi:MAG: RNA polymerase sigma factor [Planctomycetes bacterium]|nr:RNA polymerase sigma factor [Planctomycetota bacterium]MBL7040926.1 RNA polymerase sigma factor [Pirellulaceae bacterium]